MQKPARLQRWLALSVTILLLIACSIVYVRFFSQKNFSKSVSNFEKLSSLIGKRRIIEPQLSIGSGYQPFKSMLPGTATNKEIDITSYRLPNHGAKNSISVDPDPLFEASVVMENQSIDKAKKSNDRGFILAAGTTLFSGNRGIEAIRGLIDSSEDLANIESVNSKLISFNNQDRIQYLKLTADIFLASVQYPTAENFHTAALIYFLNGETSEAIAKLEAAIALQPDDARMLNDLAGLYYARAYNKDQPKDLVNALETIDKAYQLKPEIAEICFNRALMLERLFLTATAKEAWQEYLKTDHDRQWDSEVHEHIAQIDNIGKQDRWQQARVELTNAALRKDDTGVRAVVAEFPHQARVYVLEELLPSLVELNRKNNSLLPGNSSEVRDGLLIGLSIGRALAAEQQDRLIVDLLAEFSELGDVDKQQQYQIFISAYGDYRNGINAFDRYEIKKSKEYFDNANNIFISLNNNAGLAMALLKQARCEIANFNYELGEVLMNNARTIAEKYNFIHLNGLICRTLGWVKFNSLEPTKALIFLNTAIQCLTSIKDIESIARTHFLITEVLTQIGETEEIFFHQYEAYSFYSQFKDSTYLSPLLNGIASQLASLRKERVALNFYDESIKSILLQSSALDISNIYLRRSLVHYKLENPKTAWQDIYSAKLYLEQITDVVARQRLQEEINITEGRIILSSDPAKALELFSAVIEGHAVTKFMLRLPQLYLLRARAHLQLGNYLASQADLESGIDLYEQERSKIANEDYRINFFEESQIIYDEMINFQIRQLNQPITAFNYCETARARVLLDSLVSNNRKVKLDLQPRVFLRGAAKPLTLSEIQLELPKHVTIIEYALLSDRLIAWLISKDKIQSIQIETSFTEITQLISTLNQVILEKNSITKVEQSSLQLYNKIFRPLKYYLTQKPSEENLQTLVFIPDKTLNSVPFSVLIDPDTGKYLIEDYPIAIAPSSTIFIRCFKQYSNLKRSKSESILAIGNPSFDRKVFPTLPNLTYAKIEAEQIAHLYKDSQLLLEGKATKNAFLNSIGKHTIIHFSGHSIMNSAVPLYSNLIFAKEDGQINDATDTKSNALYAYELYNHKFQNIRLMILAACQTANGQNRNGEGINSLARPFLANGIPAVIASLWNADDFASSQLFIEFHKQLIAGKDPILALRNAQLFLLTHSDTSLRLPINWAPFVLVGGTTIQHNRLN